MVGIGGEEMLLNDLATLRVEARTDLFFIAVLAVLMSRSYLVRLTLSGRGVCIGLRPKAA